MTTRLGGTGIWSGALRYGDAAEAAGVAAELEGLGYSALWIPDVGGDVFDPARQPARRDDDGDDRHRHPQRLDAHARGDGRAARPLTAEHGARFLCGIGISHRPLIDHVNEPGTYQQADRHDGRRTSTASTPPTTPLAADDRVIAALGPKMLELARDPHRRHAPVPRDAGADGQGRATGIGPDGLVASEQGVVLETDPTTARATARLHLQDVPRPAELLEQLEAPGLHRRRPRRRRQRPPRRRPRGVGRRGDDRRPGPGAPRRRRRPRLHPGADRRPQDLPPRSGERWRRAAPIGVSPRGRAPWCSVASSVRLTDPLLRLTRSSVGGWLDASGGRSVLLVDSSSTSVGRASAAEHPALVTVETYGTSYEGRDL